MAEWVVESVCYKAGITGGNLKDHKVSINVRRDRKDHYIADVDVCPPGEARVPISGNSLRNADLNRDFTTPKAALDAAFRALYRHLSNNGKNTLEDLEQTHTWWGYQDDSGRIDWQYMQGLGEKEREKKVTQEFDYSPPTGMAVKMSTKDKQIGKAYKVNAELNGLDESGTDVRTGARREGHDGVMTAERGMKKFLKTRGMSPGLEEDEGGEAEVEELSGSGDTGPESGGTLASDEPSAPVNVPSGY